MRLKQQVGTEELCTGQRCAEREDCARWVRIGHSMSKWASFDLEHRNNSCESKVVMQVHFKKQQAKQR